MMGTSHSHTRAIEFTPPKITAATATTITTPTATAGMAGTDEVTMPEMAAACTAEPVPMVAMTAKAAKDTAPSVAHHGTLPSGRAKARFHTNMAPPSMAPVLSRMRYFTAA